jgi:hypothetical protein
MGLFHYKYRSQCMQKRKWRKPKEKAITRNPTKNKKGYL